MNLAAYEYQFYTRAYSMQERRYATYDYGMDVDDIGMLTPPPKPPRASDVYNNSSAFPSISTPQQSCITSTPKSTAKSTTSAANYLPVPNGTPKSIYSSGLWNVSNASEEPAELQLQPKLHASQKRFSSEWKEKSLEISKRGSAAENIKTTNNNSASKSSPSEIRQKVLEMSKRNSGSFEKSVHTVVSSMETLAMHSTLNSTSKSSLAFEKSFNNSKANSLPHMTAFDFNNTFADFRINSAPPANADDGSVSTTEESTKSVKERICFFNKLTRSQSNSFINLLKTNKKAGLATRHNSTNSQTSFFPAPLKPRRIPTQWELHLQEDFDGASTRLAQTQTRYFTPTDGGINETAITHSKLSTTSSPVSSAIFSQRKSSLRRKSSVDKKRHPIVRQNSNSNLHGTKPQMHSAMEDLSLVIPVQMRVAEYERRLKMKN